MVFVRGECGSFPPSALNVLICCSWNVKRRELCLTLGPFLPVKSTLRLVTVYSTRDTQFIPLAQIHVTVQPAPSQDRGPSVSIPMNFVSPPNRRGEVPYHYCGV